MRAALTGLQRVGEKAGELEDMWDEQSVEWMVEQLADSLVASKAGDLVASKDLKKADNWELQWVELTA